MISGKTTPILALAVCLLAAASAGLHASVTTYTSKASFDTAVSNTGATAEVVDFESIADNTLITPFPYTVGGLTFESFSTATGYQLIVDSGLGGTSGSNYLRATNNGGTTTEQLGFDDSIGLSFGDVSNALGLYIIASSVGFEFLANDINITVNGNTYSNDGGELATSVNGAPALFFGIVDDSTSFSTALISVGDIGTSLGDYDDITYSVVPEPAHLGITIAVATFSLVLLRRRPSQMTPVKGA